MLKITININLKNNYYKIYKKTFTLTMYLNQILKITIVKINNFIIHNNL